MDDDKSDVTVWLIKSVEQIHAKAITLIKGIRLGCKVTKYVDPRAFYR